jgi:hypothetical protein
MSDIPTIEDKDLGGRPSLYNTVEELQKQIDIYFDEICGTFPIKDKDDNILTDKQGRPVFDVVPPTVCRLAFHLGYASRQSIYDLEKRSDAFSYTIKRALLRCEMFAEEQLYSGRPVGAIFALKNRGWSDKSEIDITSKNVNQNLDYSALTEDEAKELFKKKQEEMKNDK